MAVKRSWNYFEIFIFSQTYYKLFLRAPFPEAGDLVFIVCYPYIASICTIYNPLVKVLIVQRTTSKASSALVLR